MVTFNTIRLVDHLSIFKEMVVATGVTVLPGMLVARNSSGQMALHGASGGVAAKAFAFEQELAGKGIDDAIPVGEAGQVWYPVPGDEVYAFLAPAQNAAIGSFLASNGDGSLKVVSSEDLNPIATAMEAVNNTASGATRARIRIEIL